MNDMERKKREYLGWITLFIALFGALFGGIPGLLDIYDQLHNTPVLMVRPFIENDTLNLYIYNEGDKIALINRLDFCFFPNSSKSLKPGNIITVDEGGFFCIFRDAPSMKFGEPVEIRPDKSTTINTNYNINQFKKLFISPAKRWGVLIIEESTGQNTYFFCGDPPDKGVIILDTRSINGTIFPIGSNTSTKSPSE